MLDREGEPPEADSHSRGALEGRAGGAVKAVRRVEVHCEIDLLISRVVRKVRAKRASVKREENTVLLEAA